MHFRIGFVILIMHARNWPFYSGRCFIGFTSSWSIHLQGCPRLMEYLHFFRHCYARKVVFPVTLNAKIMPPPPPRANLRFMPENICVFVCICTAPPAWYSTVTHSGQLRVLVPHFYFSFLGYYINHATISLAVEKFLMLPRAWGHYRMREIHCRDR